MCFALFFYADSVLATTGCGNTDFPGSGKANIRSYRQVSLAHIDTAIARGEQAEQHGLLTEAYHHYDSAMRMFVHPDLGVGVSLCCASAGGYDRALNKLQAVAGTLAEQSLAAGKYLGSAEQRRQLMQGMGEENLDRQVLMQDWGALEFYLGAYRYRDFERQLEPYMQSLYGAAGAEDHFSELLLVINSRVADLEQRQQSYAMEYDWQDQVDDTIALLPQEFAGLQVLQASRAQGKTN